MEAGERRSVCFSENPLIDFCGGDSSGAGINPSSKAVDSCSGRKIIRAMRLREKREGFVLELPVCRCKLVRALLGWASTIPDSFPTATTLGQTSLPEGITAGLSVIERREFHYERTTSSTFSCSSRLSCFASPDVGILKLFSSWHGLM